MVSFGQKGFVLVISKIYYIDPDQIFFDIQPATVYFLVPPLITSKGRGFYLSMTEAVLETFSNQVPFLRNEDWDFLIRACQFRMLNNTGLSLFASCSLVHNRVGVVSGR